MKAPVVITLESFNSAFREISTERRLSSAYRSRLARAVTLSINRLRSARRTQRCYEELTTLDDRTLADIGLTRADVSHALPIAGRDSPGSLRSQSFTSL